MNKQTQFTCILADYDEIVYVCCFFVIYGDHIVCLVAYLLNQRN